MEIFLEKILDEILTKSMEESMEPQKKIIEIFLEKKSRTALEVIPKKDLGGTSEVNSVCLLRKNSVGHTMHGRFLDELLEDLHE